MLRILIPSSEQWDEENQEFVYTKEQNLQLEHSLISLSKWESTWQKPFLTSKDKTIEETLDYVRCMTLTQNVNDNIYKYLSDDMLEEIFSYINSPQTATTFSKKQKGRKNNEIITSEVIYYWMIAYGIPFECQKWHLNRLMTLIRVCAEKNQPSKKMGKKDILRQNSALNAARRAKHHSRG